MQNASEYPIGKRQSKYDAFLQGRVERYGFVAYLKEYERGVGPVRIVEHFKFTGKRITGISPQNDVSRQAELGK